MGLTINVADDANVDLDEVDINVSGDTIEFSVEGEITDIPSEVLTKFIGEQLRPVEITFDRD